MPDELLIKRLKRRDMSAYEEVIHTYKNYVAAVVKSRISSSMEKEDVEEVVSDVFFVLWKRCHQLDPKKGSIKNYLGVIARNMAINKLRERRDCGILEDDIADPGPDSPELEVMRHETRQVLEDEIGKLKTPDKEIFMKYHVDQESITQISDDLHLNPNTVKAKLARSRKKLRKQLSERGFLYEA